MFLAIFALNVFLKLWTARFNGVNSNYLSHYLGWMRAVEGVKKNGGLTLSALMRTLFNQNELMKKETPRLKSYRYSESFGDAGKSKRNVSRLSRNTPLISIE
jgi:hypothetical protein